MFDVIIVGAGPAGITCALRTKELNLKPLLLDSEVIANTIVNYSIGKKLFGVPGFYQGNPKDLVNFYKKDLKHADIDVREGQKVVSIVKKDGVFEVCSKTDKFKSKSVVLAIGVQGTPQTLGILGEDKKHVHYKLDDPQKYAGKDVVVVGGGDTSIEAAIALSNAGANVIISYRRDSFFRAKELNVKHLDDSGAIIKFSTNLSEIKSKKVLLRHSTNNVSEIKADYVFVLLGNVKNTAFYKEIGLDLDDKDQIVYDSKTRESTIPGLFVAGDIASCEKLIMPAMCQGFKVATSVMMYKSRVK
ncbi:SidA/IucD/PvdA family monooxygenase [archaeon]|nr:SidA/IucD/PvdA family monooxygenase [archaeon]